jgi:transcriptional regulator with XRE-family HTH domain
MRIRDELGWSQSTLAARLSVSKRTISSWENGYWLPPFKQRMHVLYALRSVPAHHVLTIANALGLSQDDAVAQFLEPYERAVDGDVDEPAPALPDPPKRVAVSPEALRGAVDAAVKDVADAIDARPNDVRMAVGRVLAVCAAMQATVEEAQAAVVVVKKRVEGALAPR